MLKDDQVISAQEAKALTDQYNDRDKRKLREDVSSLIRKASSAGSTRVEVKLKRPEADYVRKRFCAAGYKIGSGVSDRLKDDEEILIISWGHY